MTSFGFMRDLSESRMFPMQRSLRSYKAHELAEIAYLLLIALRICLAERETREWAHRYCRKTARGINFSHWRSDGTDLYIVMHALTSNETGFADGDGEAEHIRKRLEVSPLAVFHWIHEGQHHEPREEETRRLFTRMDSLLRINESSMHSLRRLVQDWPHLKEYDARLAMTRLLQLLRSKAPKAEILSPLLHLSRQLRLELHGVCNPETGDGCASNAYRENVGTENLLRQLTRENASGGATCAANVATAVGTPGGIGAGFDDDYSKSVYPEPSKSKKRSRSILKRI